MDTHCLTAVPAPFPHVCRLSCGGPQPPCIAPRRDGGRIDIAELCASLACTAPEAPVLPPELTLSAPGALPYATLLDALTAARARGVRQARVVVEM